MTKLLDGFVPYRTEDAERYKKRGWWGGQTFGDILDRAADRYPDKEALVDGATRLTFSQARDKVNRLAIGLINLGIEPTERVLVQLPNWNEFVHVYFALQKIGAIDVLLIDRYRPYEINYLIGLTGATTWVLPWKYKKTDYLPIIEEVLKESRRMKNVIFARGGDQRDYLSLETLIEGAELTQRNMTVLAQKRPDPMQVAHMGPTGGTTGLPKVVPRTHNDLICGSEYAASFSRVNPIAGYRFVEVPDVPVRDARLAVHELARHLRARARPAPRRAFWSTATWTRPGRGIWWRPSSRAPGCA